MRGPHKKTLRQFYCRDHLWTIFDELARDIGCPVDYLINEAMRTYAREQNSHGQRSLSEPESRSDYHAPSGERAPLYLWFDGQWTEVNKDKFVIGRDATADLMINDSNISRRHCVVTHSGGQYQLKDLNSTNGIEFQNRQIPHKVIEEGDVFYLCSFEIRFSYRGGGHRPLSRPLL